MASVRGQDPSISSAAGDKYVISAKAGGVNYVEGSVGVVRKLGSGGRLLKGDKLEIGDRISTGPDGRAEILLNPGSYLRLGGDSAFQFRTTSLEDLQLVIDRGSAILEVFAAHDFIVTLNAPRARFKLISSGVYRLDVESNGGGTLSVWKGRALAGKTEAGLIKAGHAMSVAGSTVSVAKLDGDDKDALDQWSKERSKQLAKLTNSLQKRDLRQALLNSYAGRQWNVYNSFGLWVYNGFTGSYCFLPFGDGWYSPYGYGFGRYVGWYDLPWTVYTPPVVNGPPSGTGSGSQPGMIVSAGDRSPIPPFVRMSGSGSGGSRVDRGDGRDGGSDTYSPPIYAPSAPSMPSSPTKRESPPPAAPTKKDGR
ncbi:MAG: FecR domain-containing protein [Pyrinomonadaceae bacterium]